MLKKTERLELVDAIRGFALLAIVLLHNLEHFNLYFVPEGLPQWLRSLDGTVWNVSFFIMGGKAFATFAMLFGFSFFIQMNNAAEKGIDFRGRFAWRMVVLILFAELHSLFYNGDILLLYACIGLMLIPFTKASNKTLLGIGIFLILQPFEWGRLIYASLNPDYVVPPNWNDSFYGPMIHAMKNGSFLEMLKSNITEGQLWNNLWQIESGRLFQVPALFMFGTLLGRMQYFVKSDASILFWKKILLFGSIIFIPLNALKTNIPPMIENKSILTPFNIAIPSLENFVMMFIFVAAFSLLWFHKGNGYKLQRFIIPYGRMSLTNYMTQSVVGCFIYLNYGLNLYKTTGATACVLIGLGIFVVQLLFSTWWLKRYKQGPFEYVWKKLTFINSKRA